MLFLLIGIILEFVLVNYNPSIYILEALAPILAFVKLFYFFNIFQALGPLVYIIKKQAAENILLILIILFVFVIAFSQLFTIMLQDENAAFSDILISCNILVAAGLGQYNLFDINYYKHFEANISLLLYVSIFTTIFINMLVGMMNKTFERVSNDSQIYYKYHFSSLVLESAKNKFIPPFNIVQFLYAIIMYCTKKCRVEIKFLKPRKKKNVDDSEDDDFDVGKEIEKYKRKCDYRDSEDPPSDKKFKKAWIIKMYRRTAREYFKDEENEYLSKYIIPQETKWGSPSVDEPKPAPKKEGEEGSKKEEE